MHRECSYVFRIALSFQKLLLGRARMAVGRRLMAKAEAQWELRFLHRGKLFGKDPSAV